MIIASAPAGPAPDEAIAIDPVIAAPLPGSTQPSAVQDAAGDATPPAKSPASISALPPAKEPPPRIADPLPVASRAEPPLDIAALKARLKDTNAIGVFTKLALRNQVDDLLQLFRMHYQSGRNTGVAALRQPYDQLVLKVLALLQDSDPALARTISGSREAIWAILADREKFNSMN